MSSDPFTAARAAQIYSSALLVGSARESKEPLWYSGAAGAAWVLGASALARGDGVTAVALLANTDLDVSQATYRT